jgi:hypothetical protein
LKHFNNNRVEREEGSGELRKNSHEIIDKDCVLKLSEEKFQMPIIHNQNSEQLLQDMVTWSSWVNLTIAVSVVCLR